MKRPNTLNTSRSKETLPRKASKKFYRSIDWQRFREQMRKKKRKDHEQIVMDVYTSNKENDPKDLAEFLSSNMPLCEHNLKKGIIKVASVLDHKKRIRAGGSRTNPDNVQWVTEAYHQSKSGREAHE